MAKKKKKASNSKATNAKPKTPAQRYANVTPPVIDPNLSPAEKRAALSKWYAAQLEKLTLADINKSETRTYTQYTKENYRTYIQNPTTNATNLRNMSRFLYRVSTPYRRLVKYYAGIALFNWNLMPVIDPSKPPEETKLMKQYNNMLTLIDTMSLTQTMRTIVERVLIDGVFYGFIYTDDKNSFFIHMLDPDYCAIQEIEDGCFNFKFNLSYFDRNTSKLEYWDPLFRQMYDAYKADTTNMKWQILDPERTICIKADPSNLDEHLPAFVGMFEAVIDLIDARTIQRYKTEIENYKLIMQKIPYFSNSNEVDDFALEIDTALGFYNRLVDVVPQSVGVVLTPMDTETVDFKPDDNDSDLLATSMRSVFDDSGTSQLLFNSNTTGSVGLSASIRTDVAYVWELVECIERWMKRYIKYKQSSIKFNFKILRVDIFNQKEAIELQLKLANSGVPNKLELAATAGINPRETLSNSYFENTILKIHEQWQPLQTSYTQSSSDGEREEKDLNDNTEINKDLDGNKETV